MSNSKQDKSEEQKLAEQKEELLHFHECMNSLNTAWKIIYDINDTSYEGPLIGYAFRFALIEYSKPYKASRGDHIVRHRLSTEFIPKGLFPLHQRIIASRDQIHAHSDLTIKDASITVSEVDGYRHSTITQNYIHGLEEIENIDQIRSLIELTLDKMYVHQKKLEYTFDLSVDPVDKLT